MRRRLEDLVAGDEAAERALDAATVAARVLPGDGWLQRHQRRARRRASARRSSPLVRQQVLARADRRATRATASRPNCARRSTGWSQAARGAGAAGSTAIAAPLRLLAERLARRLEDEAAELDTATRMRIEAAVRGLDAARRGRARRLARACSRSSRRPSRREFVDWLAVERIDGHEIDVGMHRHWVDPTLPFAETVAKPAHGVLVTSATLDRRQRRPDRRLGGGRGAHRRAHLPTPALRARVPSPFDYAAQTRVFIVTDVRREDVGQVAAAYRELFLAAGGGALGLFTAIARLQAVHAPHRRAARGRPGLPLLAQHVDGMDTATLVDIFRAEEDACLLGTDAVRDGVDVPGRSLRLIVFDRVPWPRPDILHKARRAARSAARATTTASRACGCARRSAGWSAAPTIAACSCCSTGSCRRASSAPFPRACRSSGWA